MFCCLFVLCASREFYLGVGQPPTPNHSRVAHKTQNSRRPRLRYKTYPFTRAILTTSCVRLKFFITRAKCTRFSTCKVKVMLV